MLKFYISNFHLNSNFFLHKISALALLPMHVNFSKALQSEELVHC